MAGKIKARKHAQRELYPACADLYRNNPSVLNSDLANPDTFSKDVAKHGLSLCTMPKGSPFKWGVYGEAPKIPFGFSSKIDAEPAVPAPAFATPSAAVAESGEEKTEGNLVGWLISGAGALVFAGVNTLLALKILKLRAKAKAAQAGAGLPPLAEAPPEPKPEPVPEPAPIPVPAPLPEPVEPEPFTSPERTKAPAEELPVLDLPKVPVPKPGAARPAPSDSSPKPLPRPAYVPPPPAFSIEESGGFDFTEGLPEQSQVLSLDVLTQMQQAEAAAAAQPALIPEPPAILERVSLSYDNFEEQVTLVPKKKEKGLFERAKDGVDSVIAKIKGLFPWTTVNDGMVEEESKVVVPPPLPDASEITPLPPDLTKEFSDIIAGSVERVERLLPEAMRASFVRSIWTYESKTIEDRYESKTIEGERMRWNPDKGEKVPTRTVVGNSISPLGDYRQVWERGALFNVMRSLIQVARMSGDRREAYHDARGYILESTADRIIVENSALPMAAKLALRMRSIGEFADMGNEELHGLAQKLYAEWSMMTPASKKNVMVADWDDRNMSPARFYETWDLPPDSWLKREAEFMAAEQEAWEEAAPRKSVGDVEIHAVHDVLFRNEWFESARAAKRFKIAKALASVLFDPEFRSHRVQLLPNQQATQRLREAGVYVTYKGRLTEEGLARAFELAGLGAPPEGTVITLPGNRNEILPLPKAPDGEPVSTNGKKAPAVDLPADVDATIAEARAMLAAKHGGKMPLDSHAADPDAEELDLSEAEEIGKTGEPSIQLDVSEMEEIRTAGEPSIQLDVREMEEIRVAGEPSIQLDVSEMEELPSALGDGVGRGVATGVVETRATGGTFASGGKSTTAGAKETVVHEKDGSRPQGRAMKALKGWAAKAATALRGAEKK